MPNTFESSDAAGNASTVYALQIGQVAQGMLSASGDRDWYKVSLVAGQAYTFALVGTGSSGVRDAFMRLYGPNGSTLLASDDDSLPNHNSLFTFTAQSAGTYFVEAGSYADSGAGQYGLSVAVGTRATVDVPMGAGIIDAYSANGNNELSWSATPGTGATVSVGFRLTDDGLEGNFSTFSAQQITATMAILQLYMDACGLVFNRVNPAGYTDNATILLSNYNESDGSGGYAYYPGSTAAASQAGNIHINLAGGSSKTSVLAGSYSYYALMHEIGHAVGLSHPGEYNAAPGVSITYGGNAQFVQDTNQYSVMSYFDEVNTTTSWGSYSDTLMMFDIYALQQIYGANMSTRSGDTIYGFNSNAGDIYNFALNTVPALCIWDGGGIDTIDLSGYTGNQLVSLVSGEFCNIGGYNGNVSIAYGAVIENVIGGRGSDSIYLSADNINNRIAGGAGADTVYLTYAYNGGYNVGSECTPSNFTIGGSAGGDTFRNVEYLHFTSGETIAATDFLNAFWSGSGRTFVFDTNNSYGWESYANQTNSNGQVEKQIISWDVKEWDDTITSVYQRDYAGQFNWDTLSDHYDEFGSKTRQEGVWDNGEKFKAGVDAANKFEWSWYNDMYDANGRVYEEVIYMDDGSKQRHYWDPSDRFEWDYSIGYYDASGKATMAYMHYDDGSKAYITYA